MRRFRAAQGRLTGATGSRAASGEHAGRYGLLLLLLIVTYLLSASGASALAADLQAALFFVIVLLALRTAPIGRRATTAVVVAVAAGSAAATIATLSHTPAGEGAADLWRGLILLLTAVLIVRRVLGKPTVTVQSIYGALSAYLIIGLMFAAFYAAMQHLGAAPFFADDQPANTQTLQYFSFTTLTTLGYGDFTAAGNDGRALAVIEALTGQVFLATLVARLVAAFRSPPQQDRAEVRRHRPPSGARAGSRVSYRKRPSGRVKKPPPGP